MFVLLRYRQSYPARPVPNQKLHTSAEGNHDVLNRQRRHRSRDRPALQVARPVRLAARGPRVRAARRQAQHRHRQRPEEQPAGQRRLRQGRRSAEPFPRRRHAAGARGLQPRRWAHGAGQSPGARRRRQAAGPASVGRTGRLPRTVVARRPRHVPHRAAQDGQRPHQDHQGRAGHQPRRGHGHGRSADTRDRTRRVARRHGQRVHQHQRDPAAGLGAGGGRAAAHHLPQSLPVARAAALGGPVRGRHLARPCVPAGLPLRPAHRRPGGGHHHRAGVRRRHRLRPAADLTLPRGAAPAPRQARGHGHGAAPGGAGHPGVGLTVSRPC